MNNLTTINTLGSLILIPLGGVYSVQAYKIIQYTGIYYFEIFEKLHCRLTYAFWKIEE